MKTYILRNCKPVELQKSNRSPRPQTRRPGDHRRPAGATGSDWHRPIRRSHARPDCHLTTMEDEQLQQLLTAMGHTEEYDRQREFDAAVTRMRPFVHSLQKTQDQALLLAGAFTTRRQHRQVYAAVQHIISMDRHVSSRESSLLAELRLKFRM